MPASYDLQVAVPGNNVPADGDGPSFQRILVPVRWPDDSTAAVIAATRISGATIEGVLRLVHVRIYDPPMPRCPGYFYPQTAAEAAAVLDEALLLAWQCGAQATTAVVEAPRGKVAAAIAREASAWRADMIVLTRRRRPAISRIVQGSVADQVMRKGELPRADRSSQAEVAAVTPGHLSVYLAAAGAGKTIAVLDEGQRSRSSSSQAGESVQSTAASASKIDPSPAGPGCHLPGRRFPCASEGAVMPVSLPDGLLDLLRRPSPCFLATVMPDGSPQLTQTWVTTDGEHIVINIVDGMQKARNVARDPRVAVNIADPDNSRRYFAVRGRVIAMTTEGGAESIDEISQKYLGRPYPGFSGRPQTRVIITIEADSVRAMGG